MSNHELAHPELADVEILDESGDLSRSEVILKGALAAGAVYGLGMVAPFVRQALAPRAAATSASSTSPSPSSTWRPSSTRKRSAGPAPAAS